MINEDKLKLMTALAAKEIKPEIRKAIINVRAYRSDYLIKHGIYAFVMGSLLFLILAGVYALFNLKEVTTTVFTNEFMQGFNVLMVRFGIFITVFVGVNILIYNYKYSVYYKDFLGYRKLQRKLITMELEGEEDDQAS